MSQVAKAEGPEFVFPHSLTVFFPAYNDAPSLPGLVHAAFRVLQSHVRDFELIVINDGSADATQQVAQALQAQYGSRMKVVRHDVNRGYGGALRTGFATASKEFVFYTDGDGQYDVGELPRLLACAGEGVGLVNGYKIQRQDPRYRIAIGAAYNSFAKLIFRVRLRDIDCDYRLVLRSIVDSISLTSTSGTVCVELVKGIERSGKRVVEIPVHHYPRMHGTSHFFRVRSLGTTFMQLVALWFRLFVFQRLSAPRPHSSAAESAAANSAGTSRHAEMVPRKRVTITTILTGALVIAFAAALCLLRIGYLEF